MNERSTNQLYNNLKSPILALSQKSLFYRTRNVETTVAAGHDLSDSGGDEDEPSSSSRGRVTFPTLVTKSDFEDSEDIAAGGAAGEAPFLIIVHDIVLYLTLPHSYRKCTISI